MSLFAGVFCRTEGGCARLESGFAALRAALNRRPLERAEEPGGEHFRFAWSGGTSSSGGGLVRGSGARVTLVGGAPIFERGADSHDPERDRQALHDALCAGDHRLLESARGTFCAVHVDPASRCLWLIADKLALRPIYFAVHEDFVLFASALRVLAGHPFLRPNGTLQAAAELASLGFPLGTRTALADVRTLAPGQIVRISADSSDAFEYWRWDAIPSRSVAPEDMCEALRTEFERAVRLRLPRGSDAVALLSGGLDSRVIVGALREFGARVSTINFAPAGSADLILGRETARLLGTEHFEADNGVPEFWPRLAHAYEQWRSAGGQQRQAGTALWSGEGGDRVLAPVNLSPRVVAAMRAGKTDQAIAIYLVDENVALPRRLFRTAMYPAVRDLQVRGIRAEIERFECDDAARRFHLYVLCNESRRNIKAHFEDYDLHGIELVMPFYDSEFVRLALSYPIDEFLQHRLYYRWLDHLPGRPGSVPWQAYPSALPCPLPAPDGLRSQWDNWYTRREIREQRRKRRELARELMGHHAFPGWLLSRPTLMLAHALLLARVDRFGYLFESAKPFIQYPLDRAAAQED